MRGHPRACSRRVGFTMLELVLATGLAALLAVAVFQLIDTSMTTLRRAEQRRGVLEISSGVLDLLASDLDQLAGGGRGDLLADWWTFDTDGDGARESAWPRLRLVRQASRAEVARLLAARAAEELAGEGRDAEARDATLAAARGRARPALVETIWVALPAGSDPDVRSTALLMRGDRLTSDPTPSFFEEEFLQRSGRPPAGVLDEVVEGVLWMRPLFATQTTITAEGWTIGGDLEDAATSWDAWDLGRANDTVHPWNVPAAGMPATKDSALLPRRVRLELEIERPADRRLRTRLTAPVGAQDVTIEVDDPDRLPRRGERWIKIDGEWLRVRHTAGRRVTVERGGRGSEARAHEAGALVHHGTLLVREAAVPTYREDWNL